MFDLSECSIVVPVQIDSTERLEHIHFLQSYFDRFFFNHQLIIVEQGIERKIEVSPSSKTEYEFVMSNEEFSVAQISNLAASRVKSPFFCKFDADALIHPKAIYDAFQKLKNEASVSFILPYNGCSFDIQNPLREEIMQSFDFERLPLVEKEEMDLFAHEHMRPKNNNSTGLIHLFRTSVFKELGGYNEEFIGWGYEDEEIVTRFEKLNHPKQHLNSYTAFHLNHPRKSGDQIQVFKNYYRYLVVKNMPPEEVLEYIKSWNRASNT